LTEEKPTFIPYFMTRYFSRVVLQNAVSALGIFMAVAAGSAAPTFAQDSICPDAKEIFNTLVTNPDSQSIAYDALATWQKCDPNTDEGRARGAALAIWANNPEALKIILQGGDTSGEIKGDILAFAVNNDMPMIFDQALTGKNPPKGDALTPALLAALTAGKIDMAEKIMQAGPSEDAKARALVQFVNKPDNQTGFDYIFDRIVDPATTEPAMRRFITELYPDNKSPGQKNFDRLAEKADESSRASALKQAVTSNNAYAFNKLLPLIAAPELKAGALAEAAKFVTEDMFVAILNSGVTEVERNAALIPAIEGPNAKTLEALLNAGVSMKARQDAVAHYKDPETHAGSDALPHIIMVVQSMIPQPVPAPQP
jgi:hypothetical protein